MKIKTNSLNRVIEILEVENSNSISNSIDENQYHIIDDIPEIEAQEGQRPILFYTPQKGFWYSLIPEYLSDGQIDQMLQNGEIIIKDSMSLEELKNYKKIEIGKDCENAIYKGVSVELSTGVEHFSLTEKDQINLFAKQMQLSAGTQQIEYHQDGKPCMYYNSSDMQKIIEAAMLHVSYHTTYCNALNMWIVGCNTKEELELVFYGTEVPKEYISEVLKDYLEKITKETESINVENVKTKTS